MVLKLSLAKVIKKNNQTTFTSLFEKKSNEWETAFIQFKKMLPPCPALPKLGITHVFS